MHGKVELEQKIKWYLENIKDSISLEDLELIKLAQFNTNGRLVFQKQIVEFGNLNKLPRKKAKPIKYGDILDMAKKH